MVRLLVWPPAVVLLAAIACFAQAPPAAESRVWIYRDLPGRGEKDTRSAPERLFAPYGYMPAERVAQIAVNASRPVDDKAPAKGTCIAYAFQFEQVDDWMGVYTLVNGNAWGTKPGIDVPKLLGVGPEVKLALRFRARGEGSVTFKIGGILDGPHPSSLRFALAIEDSPIKLPAQFREYTIGPLRAGDLTNLIDPLCVVVSGLDNRGRDVVRVFVDDIRLELFDLPAALPKDWGRRLSDTLFVCYTPTGFDPTAQPINPPAAADIRADLEAIRALADRAGIPGERAGIITYGCRQGLEQIAPLAREKKLSVLLGIFNPGDAEEVRNAEALLGRPDLQATIVGCCVGNEAITFRRASLKDIGQVAARLRRARAVPLTTTEIVQAYGDKELFAFDFTLVNAHALFAGVFTAEQGAKWAVERIKDLRAAAPPGHLILVKEIGWPAGPNPRFGDQQQAAYWRTVLSNPVARQVNVCFFDGLHNVPWKKEPVTLPGGVTVNVGPHWPVLFGPDRTPKPAANELLTLWKKSRSQ